ncbi:histone h1 [Quercus suber]|uniref:Histone h1 n=1 Tax=Quercus suber TaxID=58331 RepID=A0AAW0JMU1_QUESU
MAPPLNGRSSVALKERRGSSPYAIAKYMEEKHKYVLPLNYKKILFLQMKNSIVRGKLIKIKASYKLSEMAKEEKVSVYMKSMISMLNGTDFSLLPL